MTTETRPKDVKDMTTGEKRLWRSEQLRLLRLELRERKVLK